MREWRRLDVSEVGNVTRVQFRDQRIAEDRRIDEMGQELFQLMEGGNCKKLLLSFSSVDFLSSSALGKLITLDKKAKTRGSSLMLSDLSPELSQAFSVTRLDRLFDIAPTEADALAAF